MKKLMILSSTINFINSIHLLVIAINKSGEISLGYIKRIILDVLKPHNPSILELAESISELEGVSGVNISLEEMDAKTHSVKITIEGNHIKYDEVQETIVKFGAEVHSIDGVSAGIKIVEEVNTPQDR